MQASVAAQLGLHRRQIRSPLCVIDAALVLLHPGQEILNITQGYVIQLGPSLHGGLLDALGNWDLGSSHGRLQTKIVVSAQIHQALMEAINSVNEK